MPRVMCVAMYMAVHGALIASVCVCVREKTFSLRHASELSLFLSTGKHLALVWLPRESCSAWARQSSDRPNLPHKNFSIFQFPFASVQRIPSEA